MKNKLRTRFFYGPFTIVYDTILTTIGYKKALKKFLQFLDLPKNDIKILEAGCGTGTLVIPLAELYPSSKIIAFDYSKKMIKKARTEANKKQIKNIQFFQGNIESISPLTDKYTEYNLKQNSFDYIFTSGVLEHVNIEKSLAQVFNLLKKDGYLIQYWC